MRAAFRSSAGAGDPFAKIKSALIRPLGTSTREWAKGTGPLVLLCPAASSREQGDDGP